MVVELFPVASPVAMVASIKVIYYRTDPNGVEAHALDVIQVIGNSLIDSSTVVS